MTGVMAAIGKSSINENLFSDIESHLKELKANILSSRGKRTLNETSNAAGNSFREESPVEEDYSSEGEDLGIYSLFHL